MIAQGDTSTEWNFIAGAPRGGVSPLYCLICTFITFV